MYNVGPGHAVTVSPVSLGAMASGGDWRKERHSEVREIVTSTSCDGSRSSAAFAFPFEYLYLRLKVYVVGRTGLKVVGTCGCAPSVHARGRLFRKYCSAKCSVGG